MVKFPVMVTLDPKLQTPVLGTWAVTYGRRVHDGPSAFQPLGLVYHPGTSCGAALARVASQGAFAASTAARVAAARASARASKPRAACDKPPPSALAETATL